MAIKTINVPFFTNPEKARGDGGSVNQHSDTKGAKQTSNKYPKVKLDKTPTNNANER